MKKVFRTVTIISGVLLTLFIIKAVNADVNYTREVGNIYTSIPVEVYIICNDIVYTCKGINVKEEIKRD